MPSPYPCLRPADQPIQTRKSIMVVRLRPKVRQTAPLLVPLYREHERPAKENRDGFTLLRAAPNAARKAA